MKSIRSICTSAALACAAISASGQGPAVPVMPVGQAVTLENILISSWRIATNGWQPRTRQPLPLSAAS